MGIQLKFGWFALILTPITPLLAQATSETVFALRRCEAPKVPVGYLNGEGILQYQLGIDGRPDTASLSVIQASRISAAGLRSAAARLLSACRMDLSQPHPVAAFLVHQPIRVDSATVMIAPAALAPGPLPPVSDTQPFAMTGVPLEHTDPRLEEKPRTLTCDEPKLPDRPSGGPYHSKAEADTAFAEWARQHQGTLRVRVVVRPDGKVIASQVKILENTNPVVKEALLRSIVSCRFAPGRSGGTPVAAFATTGATMHIDTP